MLAQVMGGEPLAVKPHTEPVENRMFRKGTFHINILELRAGFFALKAFLKNKSNLNVLSQMYNSTACAYVNKKVAHTRKY